MSKRPTFEDALARIREKVAGRKPSLVIVPAWLRDSRPYNDLDVAAGCMCAGNGRWVHKFEIHPNHHNLYVETHSFTDPPSTIEIMEKSLVKRKHARKER